MIEKNPFYIVCLERCCAFNKDERCTKTHITINEDGACRDFWPRESRNEQKNDTDGKEQSI